MSEDVITGVSYDGLPLVPVRGGWHGCSEDSCEYIVDPAWPHPSDGDYINVTFGDPEAVAQKVREALRRAGIRI